MSKKALSYVFAGIIALIAATVLAGHFLSLDSQLEVASYGYGVPFNVYDGRVSYVGPAAKAADCGWMTASCRSTADLSTARLHTLKAFSS